MRFGGYFLILMSFFLGDSATAQVESDVLLESLETRGYVSDYAGILEGNLERSLESQLKELEQKTSAEIALVILQTLKGGEIQDFSNRLFERWGVGKRGSDNGVLILAALDDKKIWVEVGYGLEEILPDALLGRILDDLVLPAFRHGRYGPGLATGVLQIAALIAKDSGVTLSGVAAPLARPRGRSSRSSGNFLYLLFLLFIFLRRPLLGMFLPLGMGVGFPRSGYGGGFSGGGFGGFGGGLSGGGGAGRSW